MSLGLTTSEAQARLQQFGPNAVAAEHRQPLLDFARKFWGPVPWMLEISIVLELAIGHATQTRHHRRPVDLQCVDQFLSRESRAELAGAAAKTVDHSGARAAR
ncbi:MAG: cation-transporting P-type ATPase [Anaerolineae bacterium]